MARTTFRVILLLYFTLLFFYERAEKTMPGRTQKSCFLRQKSAGGVTGAIYSTFLARSNNLIFFVDFPNPPQGRKTRFCEKTASTAAPVFMENRFQTLERPPGRPSSRQPSSGIRPKVGQDRIFIDFCMHLGSLLVFISIVLRASNLG